MARIHLITGGGYLDEWKQVIQTSLERKEENVQEYAVGAFGAVSCSYGVDRSEVDAYLKKIETTHMMYGRRGYALALGTLDYNMEERYAWLHDVVHKLGSASQIQVRHLAGLYTTFDNKTSFYTGGPYRQWCGGETECCHWLDKHTEGSWQHYTDSR